MTIPCREQIAVAVLAVMATVTGLTAERNRKTPLTAGENGAAGDLPRQILFEGDETPIDVFTGEDAFDLQLLIQVAIQKAGAGAATECNTLRAKLQQALLADRTLGGKCRDLQVTEPGDLVGVDVDADECEGFILALLVRYATVEGDPFNFSN